MAGIRLEFAQFGDFDSFDIIRSTSSMESTADADLPSPVVTGLKTMYWVDTDIVVGTTYYYKVRVWRDSVSMISDEIVKSAEKLLVFLPLTSGITDLGSLGLTWSKSGNITHSSDGAYFDDTVASWIKQTTYNLGSTYKFSIEFKRISGISAYSPLIFLSDLVVEKDLGYATGTPSASSALINKAYVDFSGVSGDTASQTISDNEWYKLTVERNGLIIKLYINDTLGLTETLSQTPNNKSTIYIGYSPTTTPNRFKGWMKNFKIYDLT